jgi:protein CpxP
MKTKIIGTIVLVATLSLASISYTVAGNYHGNKGNQGCNNMFTEMGQSIGRNKMGHRGMVFAQLDLTDSQKQQMQTIMSSSTGKYNRRMSDADRTVHQAEMQALMHAEFFDEEEVKALISKHQSTMSEKRLSIMKAKHQMFQLLTDEQKAQYSELRSQFQNR